MSSRRSDTFEEAFPELVLPGFRVALRILGNVADAEDAPRRWTGPCGRGTGWRHAPPEGLGRAGGVGTLSDCSQGPRPNHTVGTATVTVIS